MNPCPYCRKSGGVIVKSEGVQHGFGLKAETIRLDVYSCGACHAYIGVDQPNRVTCVADTYEVWDRLTKRTPAVPFNVARQVDDTYRMIQEALPGVYKDIENTAVEMRTKHQELLTLVRTEQDIRVHMKTNISAIDARVCELESDDRWSGLQSQITSIVEKM
jgi:hypothetical protein